MEKWFAALVVLYLTSSSFAYAECLPGESYTLEQIASQNRAILVGELHGTDEMPREFLRIVEQLSANADNIVIALEFRQPKLDAMFAARTAQEFRTKFDEFSTGDGRTSEAMKAMLEGLWLLQQQQTTIKVFGVDFWLSDHPDDDLSIPEWIPDEVEAEKSIRDIRMGENTVAACHNNNCDLLFYYAGNFHTKIDIDIGGALNATTGEITRFPVAPSGAIIARELATASIFLSHRGGDIAANVDGRFGKANRKSNTPDYVQKDHVPYCMKEPKKLHEYILSVGKLSSSVDQTE